MRDFNDHQKPVRQKRAAFTLIEILVVIAIIGVLAAVTAVAVSKVIGGQRASNTRTAMATVKKVLDTQWAHVVKEAKEETGLDVAYARIDSAFGPDPTGGRRNRIIWIKLRLMEAFPTSYYEIRTPWVDNIIPLNLQKYKVNYQKTFALWPGGMNDDNTMTTGPQQLPAHATESAACLLIALSLPRGGASLTADMLGSTNVADTDGDGIKEIVDGWGNPISFFRFPTKNKALQGSFPAGAPTGLTIYADPLDPDGVLANPASWKDQPAGRGNFERYVHSIMSPFGNASAYTVPTLVSWGPDGKMENHPTFQDPNGKKVFYWARGSGLEISQPAVNNAMSVVDPLQDADNIYSFQLR